jgi:hypothetical protein
MAEIGETFHEQSAKLADIRTQLSWVESARQRGVSPAPPHHRLAAHTDALVDGLLQARSAIKYI